MSKKDPQMRWRILKMNSIIKRTTTYIAIAIAALVLSAGSGITADDLPTDLARIFNQRKIVVAMYYEDTPPFYMHDNLGRLFGFDVELAFDIGRKLGVDVVFNREAKTSEDVIFKVANRKADIGISNLIRTQRRAIKVNFTNPYVTLYHALLINRLKTAYTEADLKWLNSSNVALGVVTGTAFVEFAQRDYPNVQIVQYPKWDQAADDVAKGKIHAALFDDSAVLKWVKDHPEEILYVKTKILKEKEDPLAIVVHWKDTHLLSWLNLYLHTIVLDGTLDKLKSVYLRTDKWKDYSPGNGSR